MLLSGAFGGILPAAQREMLVSVSRRSLGLRPSTIPQLDLVQAIISRTRCQLSLLFIYSHNLTLLLIFPSAVGRLEG